MPTFTDSFRTWRRRVKARLPYVRRREHRVLEQKYAAIIDALDGQASPAAQAPLHVVKAFDSPLEGELCLFVSFTNESRLKPHVRSHIEQLLACGIRVALIVNTDSQAANLSIPLELLSGLSGAVVRENIGFDFGAWAHAYACAGNLRRCTRLFLVNDSIVGPLNAGDFERLMHRVRSSSADVVGLTESLAPLRHLQSYFLVFNSPALHNERVHAMFMRMLNLPTKAMVIDVYETRITALLSEAGLRCEALFPSISTDVRSSDDTSLRWSELMQAGFPYIKARVLDELPGTVRTRLLRNLPGHG